MRILLTNDDGISSKGLQVLKEELERSRPEADIWIVAPDGQRSGQSHSITMKDPIRSRRIAHQQYHSSGSPADCVTTALMGLMEAPPDLIISGINYGPNLGTDLTYSGTAAAARQGTYKGIPSVAVSLVSTSPPYEFRPLARMVSKNLERFIELWDERHFININGPGHDSGEVRVTHPCRRVYHDRLESFESPGGDQYWFLTGYPDESFVDPGSDLEAILSGSISISPIHVHPANISIDERYKNADFQV
jgi:5'-nucleotidase